MPAIYGNLMDFGFRENRFELLIEHPLQDSPIPSWTDFFGDKRSVPTGQRIGSLGFI